MAGNYYSSVQIGPKELIGCERKQQRIAAVQDAGAFTGRCTRIRQVVDWGPDPIGAAFASAWLPPRDVADLCLNSTSLDRTVRNVNDPRRGRVLLPNSLRRRQGSFASH